MGCLMAFYTSLTLFYTKMSFKNPQIFQQTISLFPVWTYRTGKTFSRVLRSKKYVKTFDGLNIEVKTGGVFPANLKYNLVKWSKVDFSGKRLMVCWKI
jgi:hypothetical protein